MSLLLRRPPGREAYPGTYSTYIAVYWNVLLNFHQNLVAVPITKRCQSLKTQAGDVSALYPNKRNFHY